MVEEYTKGHVWALITEGSDDPDEMLDLQAGLSRLPPSQRTFLVALIQGFPASLVMKKLGLKGNQTKFKRAAINRLTKVMNGEEFADAA